MLRGCRFAPTCSTRSPTTGRRGCPEGRLRRFDMNLSPVPPAWYGRAVATLGRVAVNNYPDATYARPPRCGRRAHRLRPGVRRADRRAPTRPSSSARSSRSGPATRRTSAARSTPGTGTPPGSPGPRSCTSPRRLSACGGRACPTTRRARTRPRTTCRERDGLVVIDQAYVEFGGRDLSAAGARALEHRRRPHVLEGVRAGRGADRLHPRRRPRSPTASTRSGRRPRSRRSRSRSRGSRSREAGEMRARAAATVAERDRMANALRAAGLGVAGLVRELRCSSTSASRRQPSRSGCSIRAWSCARSPIRCSRTTSGQPGDRRRRRRCSWPRWALPVEPGRRRQAPASGPPSDARPRPTSAAASRSTDRAGRP